MDPKRSVSVVYDNREAVEEALRRLGQGGIPVQQVSVIAQDFGSEKKICGSINSASAVASAGVGTVGIFGLPVQAAFLWVAGSMQLVVAGPLTATLLDGLETAAAGSGLLDWLTPLGLPEELTRKYEESVKAGKYLMIVHGAANKVKKAWRILRGTSPSELSLNVAG